MPLSRRHVPLCCWTLVNVKATTLATTAATCLLRTGPAAPAAAAHTWNTIRFCCCSSFKQSRRNNRHNISWTTTCCSSSSRSNPHVASSRGGATHRSTWLNATPSTTHHHHHHTTTSVIARAQPPAAPQSQQSRKHYHDTAAAADHASSSSSAQAPTSPLVFGSHKIYKDHLAMELSVARPLLVPSSTGALYLKRNGSIVLKFAPPIKEAPSRRYDWRGDGVVVITLRVEDIGNILAFAQHTHMDSVTVRSRKWAPLAGGYNNSYTSTSSGTTGGGAAGLYGGAGRTELQLSKLDTGAVIVRISDVESGGSMTTHNADQNQEFTSHSTDDLKVKVIRDVQDGTPTARGDWNTPAPDVHVLRYEVTWSPGEFAVVRSLLDHTLPHLLAWGSVVSPIVSQGSSYRSSSSSSSGYGAQKGQQSDDRDSWYERSALDNVWTE